MTLLWIGKNHYRRFKRSFAKRPIAECLDSLVNAGLSVLSLITWRYL
jgi:hypothetical protein